MSPSNKALAAVAALLVVGILAREWTNEKSGHVWTNSRTPPRHEPASTPLEPQESERGSSWKEPRKPPQSALTSARPLREEPPFAVDERKSDEQDRPRERGQVSPHPTSAARDVLLQQRAEFTAIEDAFRQGQLDRVELLLDRLEPATAQSPRWRDRARGYRLIARCGRERSVATQAAARAFVEEFRGSTLRRHVRRACLEAASDGDP